LRTILDGLRHVVRELRRSATVAESRLGISGAQLFVLQNLARKKAGSINELADLTLTHQSSVSVVVSRLAERHLVRRVPSATDGRRMEIELTDSGRRLLSRAPEAAQTRLFEALRRMPAATRRQLAKNLESLINLMGSRLGPPTLFFEE
jgi:MarR family transcriptional regulator, lower aerobic nicotinate degradation pathway regulator